MKVHLRLLGCRLNQSEIDAMARQLVLLGHDVVDDPATAEHIIVNTCAVTQQATKDGRKLIRELNRQNPSASIIATGCYAHIAPQELAALPGVTQVVDNVKKEALVAQLTGQKIPDFDLEPFQRNGRPSLRTRAFIKVQDGCDNACTFCITTVARGQSRSRPPQDIIAEIAYLQAMGYQEAVLTGVHLGSYGHDWGDTKGLYHLVARILEETAIPRLRLSSLEPWDLSDDFFTLWANPRLCPHLHLPLQSGCDATLRRMARRTTQAQFERLVTIARQNIPNLRLTTDVIVGFPGETDEEFAISEAFIRQVGFDGLHVFRYSARVGTPAARMKGQVAAAVKRERSQHLQALSSQWEQDFAARFVGQTVEVLWEQIGGVDDKGFFNHGYTANYIRAQCVHPRALTNHITPAQVIHAENGQLHVVPMIE